MEIFPLDSSVPDTNPPIISNFFKECTLYERQLSADTRNSYALTLTSNIAPRSRIPPIATKMLSRSHTGFAFLEPYRSQNISF